MKDEKCCVYMLPGPVVCIETEEDKPRRIYLTQKDPTPEEQAEEREYERIQRIETITNMISGMMSVMASVTMVALVAHMAGIF